MKREAIELGAELAGDEGWLAVWYRDDAEYRATRALTHRDPTLDGGGGEAGEE